MENTRNMIGAFAARRLTDDSLFGRAIGGDASAFSEVYRRYEKRVYGFCLARSLDREAAADATQEVFMRLLKADRGSVEHPRAWLFTVARNVTIDAIRKRARLSETGEVDEDSPAWESMVAADTADEVASRADARNVFLALRRMKPRYRTALILREIHGQSSADIAEAMGVKSAGAVDTLVSRARDAFGVAYAAIPDLPSTCRTSIESMYRSRGSGIDEREAGALAAHLASCERCRAEDTRADDPKRLAGLLPLLVPAGSAAHSFLGQAAIASDHVSNLSVTQHVTQFLQMHLHTVGSRVAAGVLAATLVAAPVVASNVITHRAQAPMASVARVQPEATPDIAPAASGADRSAMRATGATAGGAGAQHMRTRGSVGPTAPMGGAAGQPGAPAHGGMTGGSTRPATSGSGAHMSNHSGTNMAPVPATAPAPTTPAVPWTGMFHPSGM